MKLPRPNLKTPKVKAPDMKLPPAIGAIVDNLRERGLLPVAILLVVAIVAVPFLLAGGSTPPPPKPQPSAATTAGALQTQQAVVLANDPGVRNYKQRLGGAPKDPFKQQYAAPASGGGTAATGVTQTSTGSAAAGSTSGTTSSSGSSSAGGGAGSSPKQAKAGYFYYAADLYIGVAGKKLKLRKNVKRGVSLPNDNVRAAAFVGVPVDKPKVAQFLLSSDVVQVSGDGHCALGSTCESVRLKVGDTMRLTYTNGVTYAVKLASTHVVTSASVPPGSK